MPLLGFEFRGPLVALANVTALWSLCILRAAAASNSVQVSFDHLSPIFNQSDEWIELRNSEVTVRINCSASHPTEWIANFDNVSSKDLEWRLEWTERKYNQTSTEYVAWIMLKYKRMWSELRLVCRSVTNHNRLNNVLVLLTPQANVSRIHITKYPGLALGVVPEPEIAADPCELQFDVVEAANRHYWRCYAAAPAAQGERKLIVSPVHEKCLSAAFCANTFRVLKIRPVCVNVLNNGTVANVVGMGESGWVTSPHAFMAGVAVCTLQDAEGKHLEAAVEYFFGERRVDPTTGVHRKLHFSVAEISMGDLIWMDPAPRAHVYYTREKLNSSCIVPKYGFSFAPILTVTVNGLPVIAEADYSETDLSDEAGWLVWSREVFIDFQEHGAGSYLIHCIAFVWNTTERAIHTTAVQVREPVSPSFDSDNEIVSLEVGETNRRLVCAPKGDPIPELSWDTAHAPGIRTSGNELLFSRVSTLLPDVITCIATSRLGDRANKSFTLKIREAAPHKQGSNVPISGVISIVTVVVVIFGLLLLIFCYRFRKHGSTAARTRLTEREVRAFLEGERHQQLAVSSPLVDSPDRTCNTTPLPLPSDCIHLQELSADEALAINGLPYNSTYEVPKENLAVDFSSQLGCGQFGVVYRGELRRGANDPHPTAIAVKTVPKHLDIEYFKALMSELKILAHIGQHENVVRLEGAQSTNLRNRELFVGVELCRTSLLEFLHQNRQEFELNLVQPGPASWADSLRAGASRRTDYLSASAMTMTALDLLRWARQIAVGMEFVAQKRVVHGDLAARNILLSFDLQVKISDFGLARQLIDYTYVQSRDCPRPWKWMAIEALTQKKFSTKSDVWSYAVTLWELFSLGDEPYAGMTWSSHFPQELASGVRLAKPSYALDRTYEMMSDCWRENPKDRPTFSDLTQFFKIQESALRMVDN